MTSSLYYNETIIIDCTSFRICTVHMSNRNGMAVHTSGTHTMPVR